MQNATTHIAMLVSNSKFVPSGQKLAAFMSMIAAEAISPTTTGRNPEKIALIAPLSWCLRMKCEQYKTRKKEGTVTASVASSDPSMPQIGEASSGFTLDGAT